MEKRSISGRDILRMDGLLPPTRRLPVCDAVTSSEKKKEKKWSLGVILRKISSIRDYDSSSNDEEIVYCTRQPRPRTVFNRKSHNVILHPVNKSRDQHPLNNDPNDTASRSVDTASLQRESVHSRSSDGSLEGLSKKARKSKLKARVEAKRDRICGDSSSDEDSRISSNSLSRYQNELAMQSAQKNSSSNRRSRAARTERYIKRLSKEEAHRFPENLNNIANKRSSLDLMNEGQPSVAINADRLCRNSQQSPRFINFTNSNTFPVQRSADNYHRQSEMVASTYQTKSSTDLIKQPANQYITDLNQNNAYAKPNILHKNKNYLKQQGNSYSFNTSTTGTNYDDSYNYAENHQFASRSSLPPEPPPRDPRCRVFSYSCNSFPFNGKYNLMKHDDTLRTKMNDIHEVTKDHLKSLRSYESNSEMNLFGSTKQCPQRPLSLTMSSTQCCNLSKCTNNKHNSTGKHIDESTLTETEAMKCQRRNNRNDQLTSSFKDHDNQILENKSSTTYVQNMRRDSVSPTLNRSLDFSNARSPPEQTLQERSYDSSNNTSAVNAIPEIKERAQSPSEQERERRRSSKNLEEALSELEAIYNSLRLGDEDLLDRAERRSMEEFSLRKAKSNTVPLIAEDSTDRTKDDMAYRRMHPKERPASLSEVVGQSVLSNISYLIASPILTRKDAADDFAYAATYPNRRNEPDVTRDDVVYRSIHHANNTLKVVDPQPPFGIPLGPVTAATESDYLHTTPTKPEHPRSLYIPQCEPDIVTDDLAFRTLRKDANMAKSSVENKGDQETTFGTKKKRAVRSLSANLYGLINHDTIHLRREPSLQEIKDEMCNTITDIKSLPARSDRRVVSDGELSDYDTRWRTDSLPRNTKTDINGNHPVANVNRQKLRVYISPSSKVQGFDEGDEKDETGESSLASGHILSKALNNEFWQDCVQAKSHDSIEQDTETDFMAYTRLCQDLVNLIESQNEAEIKPIEETDVSNDTNAMEESSILHIQSLGSHYAEDNGENVKDEQDKDDIEELTEFLTKPENEDSEKTDDTTFDFYLRVADENVKLIAEAFSSVADHLRDSRVSQKNSLTSQRSEIETDSTAPNTSTRSSVTYSLDDTNDDLSSSSKTTDALNLVPNEEGVITINSEVDKAVELDETTSESNTDPELDLSKAVHDLQLAAASLCKHEKEIEELEALLKKGGNNSISCSNNDEDVKEGKSLLNVENDLMSLNENMDDVHNEEETVVSTDDKSQTDDERDPYCEGESTECSDTCESYGIARSTEMRISYVTNLITVLITTYSMVLLACFLALLLATVAAS